jgi:hypothetical protein
LSWGISPPPIFGAQGTPPSLLSVFFVVIAYYSFSLFSLGGGRSVQGLCWSGPGLLWEYCVLLSSPCGPRLPKPSGYGWLAAQGPSWFLHLMWNGDALHTLEVWRGQSFASSLWFFL